MSVARAAIDPLVLDDNSDAINLAHHLEYAVDATNQVTLEHIRSDHGALRWQIITPHYDHLNFGYVEDSYWFHFRLINNSNHMLRKSLEIGYPVLDFIDVNLLFRSGHEQTLSLGDKRPFHDRPIEHRNFVVPLHIPAQDAVDVYLRVRTTSSLQLPLILWRDETLLEVSQAEMLGLGIYYGTMVVMVLYNLFVFFSVREVNYLYYVLYVSSMALFLASLNGVSYQYLWPTSIWWNDQSILFFLAGVVLFAALFTINFLRVPEVFPRLYPIGTLIVIISAMVMVSTLLLPYQIMIRVVIVWAVVGITIALIVGMYRWLHGDSSAKYYCIAWYTLLIGGVILAMNKFDVLPRNLLTENATQLGSALEVILLSFALADRLNTEKRKRYEAQLQALENERIARLAQAEALQQEKNARMAQEKALEHERDARNAQDKALEIQRRANENLEYRVKERTHELEIANKRLEELTFTDGLTGIRNRRYLNRALDREFARAKREKLPLSLLLIDIDHFKHFNDKYGHLVGDDCLRVVASTIETSALRENDIVARYGGEEFCVVLPNTDETGAHQVAEAIRQRVNDLDFNASGQLVTITVSIGLTTCIPERSHEIDQFIAAADAALYDSKHNGRNRVTSQLPSFGNPLPDTGTDSPPA
ncbi:MAG: diguanylate cyclase [Gammaproteobacteria bacterium]